MPGVAYDGDVEQLSRRSGWLVAAGAAAAVLVVLTQGAVALLVLALVAVLAGLVVAAAYALVQSLRGGRVRPSGDHAPPGLRATGGPAAQRAEAGHVSPSPSRS